MGWSDVGDHDVGWCAAFRAGGCGGAAEVVVADGAVWWGESGFVEGDGDDGDEGGDEEEAEECEDGRDVPAWVVGGWGDEECDEVCEDGGVAEGREDAEGGVRGERSAPERGDGEERGEEIEGGPEREG